MLFIRCPRRYLDNHDGFRIPPNERDICGYCARDDSALETDIPKWTVTERIEQSELPRDGVMTSMTGRSVPAIYRVRPLILYIGKSH
jgi:glutaredoxin